MKNVSVILGLIISIAVQAQIPEGLNLTFESSDVKKLERSVEDFNQARAGYDKAVTTYESVPKPDTSSTFDYDTYYKKVGEALEQLRSASQDYYETSLLVYTTYKKGADAFWKEQEEQGHYALGLEKAKYLEVLAKKAMNEAAIKRALAEDSREFQEALRYINDANTKEAIALRDQGRALQIYQDFPIEYEYGWDDDIDIKQILAQQEADRLARNEKLFGKHKVEEKKEVKKEEPVMIDRSVVEEEPKFEGEIIYRIQIAAHTVRLEEKYLKGMYKGDEKIDELLEDNWYKYQIGHYKSFKDAADILKDLNIRTAFIIAYHDGARINVKEAKKWAP